MSRPDWDSYWFETARVVSTRATCPRASIGAVLVRERHAIGSGYNGVASGQPHCPNTPEHLALDHCRDAVHAERNALTNALVPAFGATLYVVGPRPICPSCREALALCGVTDIRHRASVPTLESVLAEVVAWGCETFPLSTDKAKTSHLLEEAGELDEHPDDPFEMADVLMILAHLAAAKGVNLTDVVAQKLAIVRTRTWGQPDANGKVKAVRP